MQMDLLQIVTAVAGVTLIIIIWLQIKISKTKITGLPEPPGTFLFGHALKLLTHTEKTLLDWKLTYGSAFQIHAGPLRVLVLGSRSAAAECFAMVQASGRPVSPPLQAIKEDFGYGPVMGVGPIYDEQRRFYTRALPNFGEGRRQMEASVNEVCRSLMESWRLRRGVPLELDGLAGTFVLNSIWQVLAHATFTATQVRNLTDAAEYLLAYNTWREKFSKLVDSLAIALNRKRFSSSFSAYSSVADTCSAFFREKATTRIAGSPRHMLDQMMDKRDQTANTKSSFFESRGGPQAFPLMAELLIASLETTTRVIEFLILLLSQNPRVVARLREEIQREIGVDQDPQSDHWDVMPFASACVMEVLRLYPPAPLAPHTSEADFEFRGCRIPKNTIILANLWGVNNDPEVWENPQNFNPSRFLTEDGKLDVSIKSRVLSFSVGRRQCPGTQMSIDTIFLFLVNVIRCFDFELVGTPNLGYRMKGFFIAPHEGIQIKAIPIQ